MEKNKKILLFTLLFFIVLGLFITFISSEKKIGRIKDGKMTVKVIQSKVQNITETIRVTGTVLPQEEVKIYPLVSGQIIKIYHDSESFVKKGEVLAKIDDQTVQIAKEGAFAELIRAEAEQQVSKANIDVVKSSLKIAQSNLKKAISDKKRYKKLLEEGAVSALEFDRIQTSYEVAKATYRKTQANFQKASAEYQDGYDYSISAAKVKSALANYNSIIKKINDCLIQAPVDGYIVKRNIKLGSRVSNENATFIMVENNKLELWGKVTESDIFKLGEGLKATLKSNANNKLDIEGIIRKIEPYIDPVTRIGLVKISLPVDKDIKYGMFLDGSIQIGNKNTVVVPEESVLFKNNKYIVFKVDEKSIVHETEVKPGIRKDGLIEITNGLKPKDFIVKEGAGFLYDGDKINIIYEKK